MSIAKQKQRINIVTVRWGLICRGQRRMLKDMWQKVIEEFSSCTKLTSY